MYRFVSLNGKLIIITTNFQVDYVENECEEFSRSNSVYYISGYLCKKFFSKHDCTLCKDILQSNNDTDFQEYKAFIICKQYEDSEGLIHVKHEIFEKIQTWERHFTSIIRNTFHCKNVCKNLMAFNRDCCPQIILCSDETTTVFLKNFMTIRCHWEARFMRQELKHSEKRPNKATQTKKERLIINGL